MNYKVIFEKWEESEAGWGVRSDGFAIYRTINDRNNFVDAYWNSMPDSVPDEYSRPSGSTKEVWVSEELYSKLAPHVYRSFKHPQLTTTITLEEV